MLVFKAEDLEIDEVKAHYNYFLQMWNLFHTCEIFGKCTFDGSVFTVSIEAEGYNFEMSKVLEGWYCLRGSKNLIFSIKLWRKLSEFKSLRELDQYLTSSES